MPTFTYDHMHIKTPDPMTVGNFFVNVMDAKVLFTGDHSGHPRMDVDLGGTKIFITWSAPATAAAPSNQPFSGLEHFGLAVTGIDAVVAEIRRRGAEITTEPFDIRPGVRIAFIRAPGNIHIELLERGLKE